MDEKDWKQLPRENVIGVFTDGESVEVYYRAGGDVHNIILPYRGFLTTSDAMVAQSAEIKDVASVEELTGSGLRWLLRPKAGHTVRTLLEWISLRTAEPVRRSSKYDIPEIREAFLLDSGIRLFTAMPNTELRVAFVSLLVGCEKQSACRFDFNDPANVVIGAAVSCDDEEYSFSGDEATVVRDLFECIDHLDCDVLIGFQLASRGVHHLLAAESRAVRVADHNVAQYAERLVLARPSLLDLEALCGDATDRRAAPRDLQELADRCGTTFAGAVSRRELIGRRSCPNEVRAAAFAAVRLTRELAEKYLAGALEVARTMPRALDDVVHSFAGEHLSAKMREYYFTRGHALPVPSVGNADGGGGLIETPARGRFERVGHLDLSNAYATVIVARELAASVDALRAFPKIVGEWMRARQRAEEMARACAGAGNIHEARQWQAIVKRYKGLLVTAFGLTGARHYRFADRSVMAEIGSTVYDIARTMWDAVEDAGARVLCVDTDGLYFDSESGAELDYEWVRTHAEEAIRVASGIETLSLRVAGPHEAGLITPRLRLLSNGERKGWSDGNLSPFALRVREDVVRHLLAGASQMAVEVVKEALAALESHHVPARDVAQMFVVDGPPVLAITRPGFGRSEMSAALAGGAVDGEMIGLVKVQGGNGSVWTAVGNEMGEVQYDVEWAQAQLRTALSPLEPVFAVGKLLAGGETSDLLTSVVRNRASGVAHTRLIAGVKTDGTITKSLFVEYGDVFSEEVFAAENEDAHGLLLGFFGKPTQKASLGARVRIGDFHIELEDNLKGDLPLQASKACVEALEEMGVDCEHDVRVMFNGARSIVLRVRQDAFGVANCVELPALYRRFAALLYDLARPKVDYAEDLYDRELYNSNASYRLAGCVHRSNGFRATWISAACLCGAPSLSTLRSLPQGQQMLPFEARGAVPILRTTFDEATAGLARTTTHDENSRTKSTTTVARYQRSEKQRKLRLKVISEQKDPPCAEALMARADRGESIGFAPLAKAVLELRQRGGDRRAIAERLASGAGGPNRYETRLEFKPDGPDLIDSLWPDDPERSYYRSCSNDAARELCDFSECYRSRQPHVFSDEASPSFTEGRRLAYETTAKIAVPSEAGTVAYEVSPRSGKSTQIAEEAYERAKAGSRVLVVAQTHRALKQVAKYLAELMSAGPVYAVQLLGRGAQHEYCARDQRSRLSCKGCPKHAVIQVDGTWQKNPGLGGLSRRNLLVVTPEQSEALAGGSLCAKTTSHHLARSAPIVLATFAHLTNERWNEMARSGEMSVVFVDESDSLFDELSSGSDKLVLAMSRQSLDGVLASPCDMNCADCSLLSGVLFQTAGVTGCLWGSVAFATAAGVLSLLLPQADTSKMMREMKVEGAAD